MSPRKTKSLLSAAASVCLALAAGLPLPAGAQQFLEGAVFQPQGENLMINTPPGWRMAYMNGVPDGDYVVEFLPANETHDNWREGYMAVQRRTFPESALMDNLKSRNTSLAQVVVTQVMQNAQRACAGRFTAMGQKNSLTNGIPTSVSGGFCDRAGSAGPYGEGSLIATFQGKERLFLVQFSWRPSTANELNNMAYRITPAKLQTYLDLLNAVSLCGGSDEPSCPK